MRIEAHPPGQGSYWRRDRCSSDSCYAKLSTWLSCAHGARKGVEDPWSPDSFSSCSGFFQIAALPNGQKNRRSSDSCYAKLSTWLSCAHGARKGAEGPWSPDSFSGCSGFFQIAALPNGQKDRCSSDSCHAKLRRREN